MGAAERSGGRLLVDCLLAAGVPLMTCVPGESFLAVLDALHDLDAQHDLDALHDLDATGDVPRLVTTRHEAAAANMAEAAGKLTGRAAVCFVTRGPGATHASIALHTAYQDGTPLLLVVGQVTRALLGRDAFQEMHFPAVFGSSAKAVLEVVAADDIPALVTRAVLVAHEGRPGPVVLVIPEDVLAQATTAQPEVLPPPAGPQTSERDRTALAGLIATAQRPLLVVGGPGWSPTVGEDVRRYAELAGVPVAAAFRWQDAVDNRSPSYVGHLGLGSSPMLRQRASEADLLVAFGPRLDDPTTDGYALVDDRDPASVVQVSQDARELARTSVPGVGIHAGLADLAAFLTADAAATADPAARPTATGAWTAQLRAEYEAFRTGPAEHAEPDLASIVRHVRSVLPDDAIVTNGAGNYTVWLQRYFEFRQFPSQLAPRNGAMGYGLPAGLAAACLGNGRPVVTFTGDGDLLMSGSELATAVQHELTLVVIVVNNAMYGTIRMHQERHYPGRVVATRLHNPDFAAYARSFGARGSVVTRTDEFPPAFADALEHPGPSLIEVRTDPAQLTPDFRLTTPA